MLDRESQQGACAAAEGNASRAGAAEIGRARGGSRRPAPFARLGVEARERDIELIQRATRLALRLEIDLSVVHVARTETAGRARVVEALQEAARRVRDGASAIAIEDVLYKPRRPASGTPFGRLLLDAGARQLLIFAPAPN
jgi:hypothetical protein